VRFYALKKSQLTKSQIIILEDPNSKSSSASGILQAVESGRSRILNSFLSDAKKQNWKYQDLITEIDKVLKQFNYSFSDKVFPVTVTKGKKFKQTSGDLCKTISETNGSISDVINALKEKIVRFDLDKEQGNGDFSKYVDDCAAMGFTVS